LREINPDAARYKAMVAADEAGAAAN